MKFHFVLCVFETNNKKLFNDHEARKCNKTFWCNFGCRESFEAVEEEHEHIKQFHAKLYQCEVCDFETNIKKFFSDQQTHKLIKNKKLEYIAQPWQFSHGLVGSLYFHPVRDIFENKTLDWLEVYTSNQSKIRNVMDWLEV